ncbi:hypothetical protein BC832DRAFT_40516 [Gaertneriomyces semiglobifer]|nr:hypothetical protein BC832DRAFT_40516 [Gaertneriomyces semiglobifer]
MCLKRNYLCMDSQYKKWERMNCKMGYNIFWRNKQKNLSPTLSGHYAIMFLDLCLVYGVNVYSCEILMRKSSLAYEKK